VSPQDIGPPSPDGLYGAKSPESLKNENPDDYLDFAERYGPMHSQSTTSLNSVLSETGS